MPRRAFVDVDVAAIEHNARQLAAVADRAALCAVVKADGYGHGSVTAARAALAGGATSLAVALVEEGQVLRSAGIDAPILLLSEPRGASMKGAHQASITPTLYSVEAVDSAASVAGAATGRAPWPVHLKVDTGMHRVGVDPDDAVELARRIEASPHLRLAGTFTHLAVADEPDRAETAAQLSTFAEVLAAIADAGIDPGVVHAANSAGAIAHPAARLDMVRVGISLYGLAPSRHLAGIVDLRPAMQVRSEVTMVRRLAAGEAVSYGLRHRFDRPTRVAVVPVGYADGVPRGLGMASGAVLIGGRRHPIRGVVTMDQMIVEVTGDEAVTSGDEVVLIGAQADEHIAVEEWADAMQTISYEIVCGLNGRLVRRVVGPVDSS